MSCIILCILKTIGPDPWRRPMTQDKVNFYPIKQQLCKKQTNNMQLSSFLLIEYIYLLMTQHHRINIVTILRTTMLIDSSIVYTISYTIAFRSSQNSVNEIVTKWSHCIVIHFGPNSSLPCKTLPSFLQQLKPC